MANRFNQNKINELIEKVFGYKFYFIFETDDLLSILQKGKIQTANYIAKTTYKNTDYCVLNMIFEIHDLSITNTKDYILIIDPRIMYNMNFVYKRQTEIKSHRCSVFINRKDLQDDVLKKINDIYHNICKKEGLEKSKHHVEFEEDINIVKNLIGIIHKNELNDVEMKIINKRYCRTKLFGDVDSMPLLLDVLI